MTDAALSLIHSAMTRAQQNPVSFSAYAPSNIALAKYWGKRDRARNLPLNSSLSISLAEWGSHTRVAPAATDRVTLNGVDAEGAFAAKALAFADLFRGTDGPRLEIETRNTIPTASGLASSASGFAALTQALCGSFGLDLDRSEMSLIARRGSGSAARSFWHGFVSWSKGEQADGSDSFGHPLSTRWADFRIAIAKVDTSPKSFSSRDGMNHTVDTSPIFKAWPRQAEMDFDLMMQAVQAQDFSALGRCAEANALMMHATMQAARPSLCYLTAQSWDILDRLWTARQQGLEVYATMDAGPNIKLIYLEHSQNDLLGLFPDIEVVDPFSMA